MTIDLQPPFLVIKPGLSEEEYYRLAGEDSDWEYIDGNVIMHPPASLRHEDLSAFLLTLLRIYLGERGGAIALGSRYPMRLDPRWSPEPDIVVICDERRHLLTPSRLEGPADLAIEIVSESDSRLVYKEKLPRYREACVREIWIVDPSRREVLWERAGKEATEPRVLSSGRLESVVLPGFWIEVGWLWRPELPSPLSCTREILRPMG